MAPQNHSENMKVFNDWAVDGATVAFKALKNPQNYHMELLQQAALLGTKKAYEHGASGLTAHYAYELTQNTSKHIADAFSLKSMSISKLTGDCFYGSLLAAGASWTVKVGFLFCAMNKYKNNKKEIIMELLKITLEEISGLCGTVVGKAAGAVASLGNVAGIIWGGLLGNLLGKWIFKQIWKLMSKVVMKGGYKTLTYEYAIDEASDMLKEV